jgi:hypothetical protein
VIGRVTHPALGFGIMFEIIPNPKKGPKRGQDPAIRPPTLTCDSSQVTLI